MQIKSIFPMSIKQEKSIYVPALYSLKQLRRLKENMLTSGGVASQSSRCKKEYLEECDDEVTASFLEMQQKQSTCLDSKGDALTLKKLSKYEIYDKKVDIDTSLPQLVEMKIPTTTKIKVIVPIKKEKDINVPENVKKELIYDDNYLTLKHETKISKQMSDIRIENLRRELLKEAVQVEEKMKGLIKKEKQIVEKEKKIEIVMKEKEKLAEQFLSLALNISQRENEISGLVSENEKKISLLELTASEKDELESLLQCEKEKMLELELQNDQLVKVNGNNNVKIDSLQSEIEIVSKEKEKLAEQCISLALNISQRENEISRLVSENEKNNSLLELTVSEKDELQNLLQLEKDNMLELELQNDKLVQVNGKNNIKIDSLRSEIEIVSNEKETLAEQFIALALSTSQRENEISALLNENEKKISLLEVTVSENKSDILQKNKLIIELQNRKNSLEETNSQLLESNICNASKINSLASQLDTVLKEKEELAEKNKYLASDASTKEKEMSILVKEKEKQIASLELVVSENKSNFFIKDELNNNLQNKIDELENINCKLVKMDADNSSKIISLRLELNKFVDMEKEISTFESLISENKQSLLITKELNDKLQNKVNDLEKMCTEKSKNFEDVLSVLHAKEKKVSELETQIIQLTNKTNQLSELNEIYNLEINTLKADLAEEKINKSLFKNHFERLCRQKDVLADAKEERENKKDATSLSFEYPDQSSDEPTTSKLLYTFTSEEKPATESNTNATSHPFNPEGNADTLSSLTSQSNTDDKLPLLASQSSTHDKLSPLTSQSNTDATTQDLQQGITIDTTIPPLTPGMEISANTLDESGSPLPLTKSSPETTEDGTLIESFELEKESMRELSGHSNELESVKEEISSINKDSRQDKKEGESKEKRLNMPNPVKPALSPPANKKTKPVVPAINALPLKSFSEAFYEKHKSRRIPGKIHVGNLPSSGLTQDDVRHYFSQFGKVGGVSWPFNKKKNELMNYCFVSFDSERVSKKLIKMGRCRIKGYLIDIEKMKEYGVDSKKNVQRHTDQRSHKAWISPWMENTTFQYQSSQANQQNSPMFYQDHQKGQQGNHQGGFQYYHQQQIQMRQMYQHHQFNN